MLICPRKESYVIAYPRVHFSAELALDQLDTLGRRLAYFREAFAASQEEEIEIEAEGRNICDGLAVKMTKR